MNFKENLKRLSVQIAERQKYVSNEEMTKQALIIPFLQTLGYKDLIIECFDTVATPSN
jgi:hypothetical protein